jgi:hypothetical protein
VSSSDGIDRLMLSSNDALDAAMALTAARARTR